MTPRQAVVSCQEQQQQQLKQTFSNFTFIVRLKLFHKLLKVKTNMCLDFSETTIKTILGTILKNSITYLKEAQGQGAMKPVCSGAPSPLLQLPCLAFFCLLPTFLPFPFSSSPLKLY